MVSDQQKVPQIIGSKSEIKMNCYSAVNVWLRDLLEIIRPPFLNVHTFHNIYIAFSIWQIENAM